MFKITAQKLTLAIAAIGISTASPAFSGQGYSGSIGEAEQKSSSGYAGNRGDAYADDVNGPMSQEELVGVLKKQHYSNIREVAFQSGIYSVVAINKQGEPTRLRVSGYTGEVLFGQLIRKPTAVVLTAD